MHAIFTLICPSEENGSEELSNLFCLTKEDCKELGSISQSPFCSKLIFIMAEFRTEVLHSPPQHNL